MSRGFACSLAGIGMTILSWYGPWQWPAWPAFALLEIVFGSGAAYQELPNAARATVLVVLIVVNAGFWAAATALVWRLFFEVAARFRPTFQ